MRIFNLICDLVDRHLEVSDGDVAAFRAHRTAQIHLFLRAEALVDDQLDMARLLEITDREVRAGRMTEDDDLRRFACGRPSISDDFRLQ